MKYTLLIHRFLFLVIVALFCSCAEQEGEMGRTVQKKYFDLQAYFNGEIKRIESVGQVKKIATVDGVREEHLLDHVNFDQELKIFSNADINRPAWSDKYSIDSVYNEKKELVSLVYKTKDEDLRTKQIVVDFDAGHVSRIQIENTSNSAIADTRQLLTYVPKSGYTIESGQSVTFSEDNTFLVEVQFLGD